MNGSRTWVLLRGLTRDARHWGLFPERFAASVQGARVVAVDLPGNGTAHRLRSPWRVEEMAECCRAELSALGLAPPYSLLALSMGGMVATAWASKWPAEIDAAVLINTSMRPFSPPLRRLRPRALLPLLRLAFSSAVDAERIVLEMTSRVHRANSGLISQWASHRRQYPVSRLNAAAQLVASARFVGPRTCPFKAVLLLTSAQDALVDTRCSTDVAQSWRCAVASHPSAGHDLPLDDPDWLCGRVEEWSLHASHGTRIGTY